MISAVNTVGLIKNFLKERKSMQKTSRRVLAIVLALVMALSVFSISAVAYTPGIATTHTVFKHTEQTLAPGVEYYNNYAYTVDGKQNVYFVTTADTAIRKMKALSANTIM